MATKQKEVTTFDVQVAEFIRNHKQKGTATDDEINASLVIPFTLDADEAQPPVSDDTYFIVTDKCTECIGFHNEPQCAAVCPVDCCVPDEDHVETEEQLLTKKAFMHGE